MVLPQYGCPPELRSLSWGPVTGLWLKCFDSLFLLWGTHEVCEESWVLCVLIGGLFSAPSLHRGPTRKLILCSDARHWATARRAAPPDPYWPRFLPTSFFLQPDPALRDGNFHICLLPASRPSQDLCLKLWVFNKNHFEQEMHVETFKRMVTRLFVRSPKEQKGKKPSQFFFF